MWRAVVIVKEIVANLGAERWRGLVLATAAAAVTASVVTVELDQIDSTMAMESELRTAGRYLYVASGEGIAPVLAAERCVALGHHEAVVASGGFSAEGPATIVKAPGELFEYRRMVGEMPALLNPLDSGSRGEIYISSGAASRVGLWDGGSIFLGDSSEVGRLSVVDLSSRLLDPGPWLWAASAPVGVLDECWVEVVPAADRVAQEWISAWMSQADGAVIVSRFLGDDPLRTDPVAVFAGRPNRHAWLAAGMAIGLLVVLITWFRRAELALYRTVGSSRAQTALFYLLPSGFLMGVGVAAGTLFGMFLHGLGSPASISGMQAARQGLLMFATALLIAALGTMLISAGRLAEYIRQRL